jgi:hypothetical protein
VGRGPQIVLEDELECVLAGTMARH